MFGLVKRKAKQLKGNPKKVDKKLIFQNRLEPVVLDLFAHSGFHRASLKQLAKRTGISTRTIYKYFDSKEELLFFFVDVWLKELTDRIVDHLQGMESTKEKLRKVFWLQLDFYERNPDIGRVLFLTVPWQEWMVDKTFQQNKMYSLFLETVRQCQQKGILNSKVRAGSVIDIMQGFVDRSFTMWIYHGQKGSLTQNFDQIFEMIWSGISINNH